MYKYNIDIGIYYFMYIQESCMYIQGLYIYLYTHIHTQEFYVYTGIYIYIYTGIFNIHVRIF